MKVRKLEENEIRQAVELSRWVFDYCIRKRDNNPQLSKYFEDYTNYNNIMSLYQANQLTIWGVFEEHQMIGVSAMEPSGQVTMLYVHPACQLRGYGKALIEEMKFFGYEEYGYEQISINALPAWTSGYFMRRGFSPNYDFDPARYLFVGMKTHTIAKIKRYKTKKISGKTLALIILAFVGLILISTVLFEFWYMYV